MLPRKLSPSLGHALYFPPQPGLRNGEVVIGRYVKFWKRYDFKHVRLGTFSVQVTCRQDENHRMPLPKTKDGFPCQVIALFQIEVGKELGDMEKATHMAAAGNDLETIVRHEDFVATLAPDLSATLNASLEKIQLLRAEPTAAEGREATHAASSIEAAKAMIREESSKCLAARGFRLCDFQLELEPQEPAVTERAAIPELEIAWQRFAKELENVIQADKKRKDEAEIRVEVQREQQAINRDREVGELQDKAQEEKAKRDEQRENSEVVRFEALARIRQQRKEAEEKDKEARRKLEKDTEQRIRQRELAEAQEKANHQKALKAIEVQTEQDKAEKELQLDTIKRNQESDLRKTSLTELEDTNRINEQKQVLLVAQAKRDSEEEARKQEDEIEKLKHELNIAKYKLELAETSARLTPLKRIEIETIGEAEAKVANAKALAEHAHEVHMYDRLMDALPQVLEKASTSAKNLGEIRVLYMGGGGHGGETGQQSAVGHELRSLISSLSSMSMLREMLRFVGDLPEIVQQPSYGHTASKAAVLPELAQQAPAPSVADGVVAGESNSTKGSQH